MARQATAAFVPTQTTASPSSSDIVVALVAGVASSVILLGKNVIFELNYQPTAASLVGMNISFGNSASSTTPIVTPTAANCYSIPPNVIRQFDMGSSVNEIQLFATNEGTAFIKILSVN